MSSLDPNDGLTDAEVAAGGRKYSNDGMPIGFVQGRNGIYYKQVNGALQVASPEEVQAAIVAQRAATAGSGITPANKQVTTDERTGEAIVVDPRTGTITRTGQQIGFAGVDPRQTAAAQEQRAAAERALTARGQAIDLLKQSQNTLQRAAEDAEAAKVDRAKLKSNEAISNAQLKEQARQADLRAAVDQYNTALNLIPALGQLSIEESKRVQGILSEGNDFLARAFESRGGTSPLARVLQADQIGAVSGALSTLRSMISDAIAQSPMAKGGGFDPVQQTQIDPYQPADLTQASSTGMPGGGPGVAPVNDPGAYQFTPAPEIQPVAAPAAAAGGGGFGGAAQAQGRPMTADDQALIERLNREIPWTMPAGGVYTPTPADPGVDAAGNVAGWTPPAAPQNGWAAPVNDPMNPNTVATGSGSSKGGWWSKIWGGGGTNPLSTSDGYVNGYAEGTGAGFTRAHMMMVGDSVSGKPTGHEEVVVNPTNAPIQVIPNEQARGFMAAMPRYATGTGVIDSAVGAINNGLASGGLDAGGAFRAFGQATAPVAAAPAPPPLPTTNRADPTNLASYGPTPAGYKLAPWAYDPMSVRSAGTPFIKIGGASDPNARVGFARTVAPSGPTQAELVALSQANLPPAARAVMNGTAVPARTALASTVDPSKYLRPMTARQLNSLDGQELKAMGTATNVEFNAPLDYVTGQTARQYGASQQRRSGFVGAMGL